MKCLRCLGEMYRVVNPDKTAKSHCTRCSQWTDCAKCSKCGDTKCLPCYNKSVTSSGQPKLIRSEPIIPDEEMI